MVLSTVTQALAQQWVKIDEQYRKEPQSLLRASAVLLTVSLSLILNRFYGGPDRDRQLRWVTQTLADFPYPDLVNWLYWGAAKLVSYALLPWLCIRLVLKQPLADYGLSLNHERKVWLLYVGMAALVVPMAYAASHSASFLQVYPKYRAAGASWPQLLIWESIYGLQFLMLEFFFRGFMLFALARQIGSLAIFVMVVPYSMIHFGKPFAECVGSIIAGIALGTIALRTGSIAGGVMVHCTVAWGMDLFALLRTGSLQRLIGLLVLALCVLSPRPAEAWCRANVETPPLGTCELVDGVPLLQWTRGCVQYGFHRDFFTRIPELEAAEIRADFDDAFAAWRDVDCGGRGFAALQLSGFSDGDRAEFLWDVENESLISVRTLGEWRQNDYDPNAIALTLVFFDPDSGEIYDVDMELNAGIGSFTHCQDRCTGRQIDLPSTVMHEAGHYLGLGHSDVAGSTMSAHADLGNLDKRTLAEDDREGYCALELPAPKLDDAGDPRCKTPVFPRFVEVERPASESEGGCAVALAGREPAGSGASPEWLVLVAGACWLAVRRARRLR